MKLHGEYSQTYNLQQRLRLWQHFDLLSFEFRSAKVSSSLVTS